MLSFVSYCFAVLTSKIADAFKWVIEEFQPRLQVEAKRANEQIKATATLINAAAGGTLTALVIARIAADKEPNYPELVLAVGFALWMHAKSRAVLGLLKDENLPSSSTADRPQGVESAERFVLSGGEADYRIP